MEFIRFKNRVNLFDGKKLIGYVTFPDFDEGVVVINHTHVNSSYQGQGLASLLMNECIQVLKESNRKCRVSCSYAAAWFEKHPEYKNLLE